MIKLSGGMTLVLACVLYLNGPGFRRIGAILSEGMPVANVNHNSVIQWVSEGPKDSFGGCLSQGILWIGKKIWRRN